jgi:hypothetical protein
MHLKDVETIFTNLFHIIGWKYQFNSLPMLEREMCSLSLLAPEPLKLACCDNSVEWDSYRVCSWLAQ